MPGECVLHHCQCLPLAALAECMQLGVICTVNGEATQPPTLSRALGQRVAYAVARGLATWAYVRLDLERSPTLFTIPQNSSTAFDKAYQPLPTLALTNPSHGAQVVQNYTQPRSVDAYQDSGWHSDSVPVPEAIEEPASPVDISCVQWRDIITNILTHSMEDPLHSTRAATFVCYSQIPMHVLSELSAQEIRTAMAALLRHSLDEAPIVRAAVCRGLGGWVYHGSIRESPRHVADTMQCFAWMLSTENTMHVKVLPAGKGALSAGKGGTFGRKRGRVPPERKFTRQNRIASEISTFDGNFYGSLSSPFSSCNDGTWGGGDCDSAVKVILRVTPACTPSLP